MRELRIGESAVSGRVSGLWNKETRTFEVKRGSTQNGKRFQIFEMSVSSKDKDSDTWKNGKGQKVFLFGDKAINHGDNIGIVGKLVPDNYTTQDGKEVYGNMLMSFSDDLFEPASWEKKETNSAPTPNANDDW